MRPPNLDADALLFVNETTVQAPPGCRLQQKACGFASLTKTRHRGGNKQDLAWGSQSPIVRLVCGRFAGEGIKLGLEEWLHRAVLAASPEVIRPRADGAVAGASRGAQPSQHTRSAAAAPLPPIYPGPQPQAATRIGTSLTRSEAVASFYGTTVAGAGSARRERSGIRGAAPVQSLMPHCPQHNRRHRWTMADLDRPVRWVAWFAGMASCARGRQAASGEGGVRGVCARQAATGEVGYVVCERQTASGEGGVRGCARGKRRRARVGYVVGEH